MNLVKKLKKYVYDRIPRKDLHGFDYTVKELVGMWESSKWAVENWHGQILNNDFLKYKKSDTIFILGSGPSINDITQQQWDVIARHDSIGFNWWFVHDFVPSFYMFQSANDRMLNILRDKHHQYSKVPFLLRGSAFASGKFDFTDERLNLLKNQPVYFINEYPIAARCSIEPKLLYRYMEALGLLTPGRISKFIPKWRSSLGLIISLSFQMGYKKIVLCGADMQQSDHFWDYEPFLTVKKKYRLPEKGSAKLKFRFESGSSTSLPRYIYTFRDWMNSKNGVKTYIINNRTILHPKVELYRIEHD